MGAKDYKFNSNDQQARAHAVEIANSNAPQGAPTELILAEAEKIMNYILDGLEPDTDLTKTVERVIRFRHIKHEQEAAREELRLKKEALDIEAEQKAFDEAHSDQPEHLGDIPEEMLVSFRTSAQADAEAAEDADAANAAYNAKFDQLVVNWRAAHAKAPESEEDIKAEREEFSKSPEELQLETKAEIAEHVEPDLGNKAQTPPVVVASSPAERAEIPGNADEARTQAAAIEEG